MMQAGELLSFASADGVLLFELRPRTAPKAMLAMTNTSSSSVVFKVRTTQPMWYYVRPNQDMLEAGQTVDLVFTLTEPECERFLDLYKAGNVESVDKHRFLIQAKPIEASDRDLILSLPAESPNRNAEFTRIWETGNKDDRKMARLKVEFDYPVRSSAAANADDAPGSRSSPNHATSATGGEDNYESGSAALGPESSYEACWAELQGLKKKYDQVREYTVHLTAERDSVVAKLERLQNEMLQDSSGGKTGKGGGVGGLRETARGVAGGDYSLFFILLAALLSFVLGYFLS